MRQGKQRICLRIVSRTTALGNVVSDDPEATDAANAVAIDCCRHVDDVTIDEAQASDVLCIHEYNPARAFNATEAVTVAVDGCVELVVGAQRSEMQNICSVGG